VSSAEVPVAKTWPTYHGGADLCGYSDLQLPDKLEVLWQYVAEGDIRQAVVGDLESLYFASSDGLAGSLDFTGKERWKKTIARATAEGGAPAVERINAPVSVFRSTVFVGSQSGTVYALNAQDGETKWTFGVGGEVLGAMNVYEPSDPGAPALVYAIEREHGLLHAVRLDNGAKVWQTDPIARTDGSMAVANGVVAYGSCDFALHAYGAPQGTRRQVIALCSDCQVASGPAIVGDEIYSGSRSGHFYRADAKTGAIVWMNEECVKEIFTTPALAKDVVVFGSEDGNMYCLDRATGKQRWKFEAGGLPTSPIIASNKILFGTDGKLIMLVLDSGKEVWRYEVSDGIASPSIINGMVVVGSEDGTVIAFGAKPAA
jgi:outer membrane protein assembly factor BamB